MLAFPKDKMLFFVNKKSDRLCLPMRFMTIFIYDKQQRNDQTFEGLDGTD